MEKCIPCLKILRTHGICSQAAQHCAAAARQSIFGQLAGLGRTARHQFRTGWQPLHTAVHLTAAVPPPSASLRPADLPPPWLKGPAEPGLRLHRPAALPLASPILGGLRAGVAITGFPPTTGPSLVSMVASSHAPYAQQLLSAAATNLLSSVAADVAVRLGHSDVQDMRADRPGPASLPSSVLPSSHGADSTATTTTTRTSYRLGRASAVTYEADGSFPAIITCSAATHPGWPAALPPSARTAPPRPRSPTPTPASRQPAGRARPLCSHSTRPSRAGLGRSTGRQGSHQGRGAAVTRSRAQTTPPSSPIPPSTGRATPCGSASPSTTPRSGPGGRATRLLTPPPTSPRPVS